MISNISKASASRFKSLSTYTLEKKGATFLGGNMSGIELELRGVDVQLLSQSTPTPSAIAREFEFTQWLSRVTHPCCHISLSLHPDEEDLEDEQWLQLCQEYLETMGFDLDENQYFVAKHTDREHPHVHIVANRVNLVTGMAVSDSFDRFRSQSVLRELERKYALEPTQSSWEVQKKQTSERSFSAVEREQNQAETAALQSKIEGAIAQVFKVSHEYGTVPSLSVFAEQLVDYGVALEVTKHREAGHSITYRHGDAAVPSHKLGQAYQLEGLTKKGISFTPSLDLETIQQIPHKIQQVSQVAEPLLDIWKVMASRRVSEVVGTHYRFQIRATSKRKKAQRYQFVVFPTSSEPGSEPLVVLESSRVKPDPSVVSIPLEHVNLRSNDVSSQSPLIAKAAALKALIAKRKSQEPTHRSPDSRSLQNQL